MLVTVTVYILYAVYVYHVHVVVRSWCVCYLS